MIVSTKKNYLYNSIYTLLNMFLPLITAPYLARVIGPTGVGIYAYNFSIAQYFVLIAKLGLVNYGTREIAKNHTDKIKLSKIFTNLFLLQCLSTVIVTVSYLTYIVYFSKENMYISTIFLIWVIGSFLDIDWFWFGLEEFKKVSIRNIIVKFITVLCVFIFVKDRSDVSLYCLIMIMGYVVGYFTIWKGIKNKVHFSRIELKEIKTHFKPCLFMLIPVLSLNIYRSMDKVMLGAICGMSETGIFDNGEKLIYCLSGLIASLGTVMMPKMSYLVEQRNTVIIEKYISLSLKFIIVITSIMSFGLIAVSDSVIFVLFGKEFTKSAIILSMCAPTLLFMGWSNVIRTQYIIPYKKDKIYIKSILYGSIINIIINTLLIPKFASPGAVVGTLAAELFVPIYQFKVLRKEINFFESLKKILPYILIGLTMTIILKLLQIILGISLITLIIQLIVGAIIFLGCSIVYVAKYDKELWELLENQIKIRKR